jgi:hypothetical protein
MVKRSCLTAVIVLLLLAVPLWAETDLKSPVYTLLSRWEDRGLIGPLPLIRPYPPALIESCLRRVAAAGGREDRRQAEGLLAEMKVGNALLSLGDAASLDLSSYAEIFAKPDTGDSFFRPAAGISLAGSLSGTFAYEGELGLFFNKQQDSDYTPYLAEPENFYHSGGGAGGEVTFEHLWQGGIFWGSESLYFQAGLMRTAFGPFFDDSAVVGPQAPEAGHFSFTYRGKTVTFSSLMLQLIAKYYVQLGDDLPAGLEDGELYSLKGAMEPGVYPSKYLVTHSVDVRPAGWLTVGFVQTVIYGGRFDPLYLIPFQDLAGTQTYSGDYDNNLLGLYARFYPLTGLTAGVFLYIDDLNMNEIMKLNLSSNQNKLAFQAGLAWSPEHPLSPRISLDYQLLTPYMYSHLTREPYTYPTYTHDGRHLGSTLEPNSDRVTLKASLFLRRLLAAELTARYIRHGNFSVAADVPDQWEGTLWDDGIDPSGDVTFYGPSTFLTQDVLERTLQLGCSLNSRLPLPRLAADLRAEAGYTFEYIKNPGFVDGASEASHYLDLLLGFDW